MRCWGGCFHVSCDVRANVSCDVRVVGISGYGEKVNTMRRMAGTRHLQREEAPT